MEQVPYHGVGRRRIQSTPPTTQIQTIRSCIRSCTVLYKESNLLNIATTSEGCAPIGTG